MWCHACAQLRPLLLLFYAMCRKSDAPVLSNLDEHGFVRMSDRQFNPSTRVKSACAPYPDRNRALRYYCELSKYSLCGKGEFFGFSDAHFTSYSEAKGKRRFMKIQPSYLACWMICNYIRSNDDRVFVLPPKKKKKPGYCLTVACVVVTISARLKRR